MKKAIKNAQKKQKVYRQLMVLLCVYIIVGSLFKYSNTGDSSYLITPAVLLLFVCWELFYQYFRVDDKK